MDSHVLYFELGFTLPIVFVPFDRLVCTPVMCRGVKQPAQTPSSNTPEPKPSQSHLPAFTARRLTSTTFLINEWDDIWDEHPFIYAKIVPAAKTILLDTGCGGRTTNPDIDIKDLRTFIETVPVDDNARKPLNRGESCRTSSC